MLGEVLLGFEVPTGEPLYIRPAHLAIFGMTQLSGKTTTLEALIARSGLRGVAFITKRGEKGFTTYHTVPPYYRERVDWRYVESLLNTALGEKVKYEPRMRWGIMQASKGAKTLRDVQDGAVKRQEKSKKEWDKEVYGKLVSYLDLVLPELEKHTFAQRVELSNGINVMDLSDMQLETQQLIIASTIEYIYKNLENVVVIIPEAWEMLPQSRMTPVKWIAEQFIRKGAAINNFVWIDSIPSYEAILVRYNDVTIEATSLESLYNYTPGTVEKTDKGEEIKTPSITIDVLGPSSSRLEWTRVKRFIRHKYSGPLLRLNTVGGVVDVSPNHPVMKIPCHIVPAEKFSLGERIASRDFEGGRLQGLSSHLFIGSNELAWLYGLFAAEGHVSGNQVVISNSNMDYLKRAQQVFKEELHHSGSISAPRNGVSMLCVRSPRLALHFDETSYVFEKHGARAKNVPVAVMNGPKDVKESFLIGVFQGDGSFSRGYMRNITSVSRPLLLGVSWLLKNTNFSVHTRLDKPDAVSLTFNKTEERTKARDELKKIETLSYKGYLYDLEVESEDHTFYLGIGNLRVHNSQDIGGIDKTPLRQVSTWIMGRMMEAHEVERIVKQLLGVKVPAREIQTLPLGHFFVTVGDEIKKVYVLPAGLPEWIGENVAMGKDTPLHVKEMIEKLRIKEEEIDMERLKKVEQNLEDLVKATDSLKEVVRDHIEDPVQHSVDLREDIKEISAGMERNHKKINTLMELEKVRSKLAPGEQGEIQVTAEQAKLIVTKETKVLELTQSDLMGRIAIVYTEGLIPEGWFTTGKLNTIMEQRFGTKEFPGNFAPVMEQFVYYGFFEKKLSGRRPDYQIKVNPEEAKRQGLLKVD